jgi:ABC-2 type transport system permease protein
MGFPGGSDRQSRTLAVSLKGSFESYFKDKPSPFAEGAAEQPEEAAPEAATPTPPPPSTVEESPASARLVVVGSAEFVDDVVFNLSSSLTQDRYLNSLKFVQNCVAWSTEDEALLNIRTRGSYSRVLVPLSEGAQSVWEGANYIVALLALVVIGIVWNSNRRREEPMDLVPREELSMAAKEVA